LRGLYPEAQSGFLWTLTFSDREKQVDALKAAQAFADIRVWLYENEWHCIRVMEQGSRNGNWHYHLVTLERMDWHKLHDYITTRGFGTILHVVEKPLDALDYVAKYVAKNIRSNLMQSGRVRKWGCIGFSGCTANNVRIKKKTLQLVKNTYDGLWEVGEYRSEGTLILQWVHRQILNPLQPVIKMIELKPATLAKIQAAALSGTPCIVGEYRVCDVVTKDVSDFKTGVKVPRVLVSHTIETSKSAIVVAEWLPPGSDAKTVKAPAKKGDIVIIEVQSMASKFGSIKINGTVTPVL